MQLQLSQYVIAMTFAAYLISSALVATFKLPANHNQTVAQALIASPNNQTNLSADEEWPIKDDYWLEISKSNIFMELGHIHTVLKRADRLLGKRPAGEKITGVLSIKADRTTDLYNEGEFVFTAIHGKEVTVADALLAVTGLTGWYQSEPLSEKKWAIYFYLTEQGPTGQGIFGNGALKRVWQKFPPSVDGNVSVSR